MNGLILEVREKTIILMSPQGAVVERPLPKGNVIVGQKVQFDVKSERRLPLMRRALAFASFLMVCLVSAAGYGYTQPFGVVNLDINPSFQMTYNAFEQVLDVKGLNSDASLVLQGQPSFSHQALPETVQTLITAAQEKGFITANRQNVIYYAVSDRYSVAREEKLLSVLWNQVPDQGALIARVLLKGSPEMYRMTMGQEVSPIPELMDAVRASKGPGALYHSDIPIQDIGKPKEPAVTPNSEIRAPEPPVEPPKVEEKAPTGTQEKPYYQEKDKTVPQTNTVTNPEPGPVDTTTQQLQKPEVDQQQSGAPTDGATPVTPSTEGSQGSQTLQGGPATDTGGSTTEPTPTEPTTPGNGSPDSPGSDGGSGSTSSPGKGGQ